MSRSQIMVRTNRCSVSVRLIGKRVRVVLHTSHMVVYDRNVEVARHERLIAKVSCRLELDRYLEALIRKPARTRVSAVPRARHSLWDAERHWAR
ncbi:Mu transposase domain-containing protein [Streptomyces griseoluteus]|uniref:Mu transposase domain-containing protein n=1 Tax=Streptomyces griseoluteus TaxID=29306 RepID=UPI0034385108